MPGRLVIRIYWNKKFIRLELLKIFAANISKCIYLQLKCDTIATSIILTSDSLYNRMVLVKRRHEKAVCLCRLLFLCLLVV